MPTLKEFQHVSKAPAAPALALACAPSGPSHVSCQWRQHRARDICSGKFSEDLEARYVQIDVQPEDLQAGIVTCSLLAWILRHGRPGNCSCPVDKLKASNVQILDTHARNTRIAKRHAGSTVSPGQATRRSSEDPALFTRVGEISGLLRPRMTTWKGSP